jgi:hypothetical protein
VTHYRRHSTTKSRSLAGSKRRRDATSAGSDSAVPSAIASQLVDMVDYASSSKRSEAVLVEVQPSSETGSGLIGSSSDEDRRQLGSSLEFKVGTRTSARQAARAASGATAAHAPRINSNDDAPTSAATIPFAMVPRRCPPTTANDRGAPFAVSEGSARAASNSAPASVSAFATAGVETAVAGEAVVDQQVHYCLHLQRS